MLEADVRHSGSTAGELPPVAFAFLEQLRRLPLGAWADAGRRLAELDEHERLALGRNGSDATATVRAVLRREVSAHPRVAAQARQRVLHLAAVAHGFLHPTDVARMKKAALAAVLALIARPELGEQRFAAVYDPFAALIPLATLSNVGAESGVLDELASTR
jgi:hypothetical protein